MKFKSILLILFVFTLAISYTIEAKCVPRNSSNIVSRFPTASQKSATPESHAPSQTKTEQETVTTPVPDSPPPPEESEHSLASTIQQQFESSKARAASFLKGADNRNPDLGHWCGLTDNPQLCSEVVAPFLKNLKDPISVLHAAMQAALDHLNLAIEEAKKFAKDSSFSGIVRSCIDTCLDNYESALDDINKSFTAIDEKDIGSLNSNLDSALTMVGTCEDTFDENPGAESPMQDIQRKLSMMIDNCLAIRNAVKEFISPPVVV